MISDSQSVRGWYNSSMDILAMGKIHLVGIKGVALTALALCLSDAGIEVSGSDIPETFVTGEVLDKRKFKIFESFSEDHISKDINLVVYTGAHSGSQNIEVKRAVQLGVAVMSHAEALGNLTRGKRLISVCGTGGKSTTSAMCAWILEKGGLTPSFAVGVGNVPNFGVPGRFVSKSSWFVAEADEYAVDPTRDLRPRFVYQQPEIIICTNLKYDHPDIYPTFEQTKQVFLNFFNTLPENGTLIVNGDDQDIRSLLPQLTTKAKVVTVGTSASADFFLHDQTSQDGITKGKVGSKELQLSIPGIFNLMNAQMAVLAASIAGVTDDLAIEALRSFKGTMRRFESKGTVKEALWYDDYAHTPEEIQATLSALRSWHPDKKIIAVFQPHTYSRTKALFNKFSQSFTLADELILLDIFASAREKEDSSVSSDMLADSISKSERNKFVKNVKTIETAAKELSKKLTSKVVVMTLGAGDVYQLYDAMESFV